MNWGRWWKVLWRKGIGGEKSSDNSVAVVKGSGDKKGSVANGSLMKRSLANSPLAKVATPYFWSSRICFTAPYIFASRVFTGCLREASKTSVKSFFIFVSLQRNKDKGIIPNHIHHCNLKFAPIRCLLKSLPYTLEQPENFNSKIGFQKFYSTLNQMHITIRIK